MFRKVKKYLKFAVCCTLILSLIAPSYAALSASDGSAFVTKAEFDSALADFNARLTTFEAGINSKIDSQVSSYLDRNGIWNMAEQSVALSLKTSPNIYEWEPKSWRNDSSVYYDGYKATNTRPAATEAFETMLWRYIYSFKETGADEPFRRYLKDRNNTLSNVGVGTRTISAAGTWVLGSPKVLVQRITKSGLCCIKYQSISNDSGARFGINIYNINYFDADEHLNIKQTPNFTYFYPALNLSSFVFRTSQETDTTEEWRDYDWQSDTLTDLRYYIWDGTENGTRREHIAETPTTGYLWCKDDEDSNWGLWKVGLNTAPMQTFFFVSKDDKLWLTDALSYNAPAGNLCQAFWYNRWRLEGNNYGINMRLDIGVY